MGERRWYLFNLYVSAEPDEVEAISGSIQALACTHDEIDHVCDRDWVMSCFELVHLDDPQHEDEVAWKVKVIALPSGAEDEERPSDDPDLGRILGMVAWEAGLPLDED